MLKRVHTKRPGQTLIEVTIAIMIAAITTVAVFSVVLSSFVSQKKADKKELVAMLLKEAQQTLQDYVSVVPNDANYSPNPGGKWSADSSGVWALAAGVHDISSLMNQPANAELRRDASGAEQTCAAGGFCYLTYTVTNSDCLALGAGNTDSTSCKTVLFSMKYAD